MIKIDKKYHAKALLFGEYTIILGSSALSVPLPSHFGRWNIESSVPEHVEHLRQLSDYVNSETNLILYQDAIDKILAEGKIQFDSNIPIGYGMGSSGAVAAAFYDSFVVKEASDLEELKLKLASIECFYHGKSSGIDPLTSYLNIPLLFHPNGQIELIEEELDLSSLHIYLLDSGIKRSTAPLVQQFMQQKKEDASFASSIDQLCQYNNEIIHLLISNRNADIFPLLNSLSELQHKTMKNFIPNTIAEQWEKTLQDDDVVMKLCGAGGGGFFLVFAKEEVKDSYFSSSLIKI